jgi:hypothetical protein
MLRLLFDPDLIDVGAAFATGENAEFRLEPTSNTPVAVVPRAGSLWLTIRQRGDLWVLNLVDLSALDDDRWNAPKPTPATLAASRLVIEPLVRVTRAVWNAPFDDGAPLDLEIAVAADGRTTIALPAFTLWGTLAIEGA